MGTVLVVGGVNHDLTVMAASRPAGGETVVGEGPVSSPGGKGANQAVAAASVGATVRLCAVVGADAAGTEQLTQLAEQHVDVEHVRVTESSATGVAFILLTSDGENSIVVGAGANADLDESDVERSMDDDLDVVLVQTEPGTAPAEAALRCAERRHLRMVLNAAPTHGLTAEVLAACDPLIVNEHEAAELVTSEKDAATELDPGELVRKLREAIGCPSIVVSLGRAGAVVMVADDVWHVAAPAVTPVDTTGAGDVLVGVIAARLSDRWDLVDAVTDACRHAAEAVTFNGARGYVEASVAAGDQVLIGEEVGDRG